MNSGLRERLHDLANDAPTATTVPRDLVSRARRHMITRTATIAAVTLLVVVGTIGALRTWERGSRPMPADPVVSDSFSDLRGKILYTTGDASVQMVDPSAPGDPAYFPFPDGWSPIDWSWDGQHILAAIPSRHGGLGVVDADGSSHRIGGADWGGYGSFSPDGASVAVVSADGLSIVDLDTGASRTIVHAVKREFIFGPALSPDGSTIVFWDRIPSIGTWVVTAVAPDGTGRHVLATLPGRIYTEIGPFHWSPDGSRLLYWLNKTKYGGAIFVMDADGSNIHRLTDWSGNVWPSWSPDGTQIAFDGGRHLMVMDADGSHAHAIGPGGWVVVWTAPAQKPAASSG